MNDVLNTHIKKFIDINDVTLQQALKSFVSIDLKKRQVVQQEGALCPYLYFVAKGCLRLYYDDEKGTEQTIQFALENWWMTDIDAFNKKGKSMYSIQAVEATSLLCITKDDFDTLLLEYPELEKYFRCIYERAYSASLFKMKVFRLSKEAFYHLFIEAYPEFIQRIPQKILASFLGFTPEYLSELRKKRLKKQSQRRS